MTKKTLLLIVLSCILLLSGCANSNHTDEVEETEFVLDYSSFMSDNLISYLQYFYMPRAEVEKLAVSTLEDDENEYNLGEITFLGRDGYAVASYGNGKNEYSKYNTLYWIDIITDIKTSEMEDVKIQLEEIFQTKCSVDRYEDGKQYMFNIYIPNTSYWIHAEDSYDKKGSLLLTLCCDDAESYNGDSDSSPDYDAYPIPNTSRHTDSEAWVCAQKIVKDNLKSPASADFCSFSNASVTHLGDGEYMVTGWVDAQNSFGASTRENFVVTYTATSSGYKNGFVIFD